MRDFIKKIYDSHEKDWVDKIIQLRHDVVIEGKKSSKLRKFISTHSIARKELADENRLDVARSCNSADCLLLYLLIKHFRPVNIMEVGTWFGASTYAMAQSLIDNNIEGKIYTCDKHDTFLNWEKYRDKVVYYNLKSGKFFNKLDIKIDMCFVDGALKTWEEAKTILSFFRDKILYINHDWHCEKGQRNFRYMKKAAGDRLKYIIPPEGNKEIVMDDGRIMNYWNFIICSKELCV